jgi:MOSC domain-containing protein
MHVVQLWRYPVKSLGGEPLQSARFDAGGIPFDRRVALMDTDPLRAGKPMTGRKQHRLLAYGAFVRDGEVFVRAPSGDECALRSNAWLADLERFLGQPVTLRISDEAIHDDSDVLVLNAASLSALTIEYGAFVNPIRFRPNVIVDGPGVKPFDEVAWPGSEFSLGQAVLQVSHPCERCVLTTVDPETLETDPSFLKLVVQRHEGRFGVYCKVVKAGEVRLGDEWCARSESEVRM